MFKPPAVLQMVNPGFCLLVVAGRSPVCGLSASFRERVVEVMPATIAAI